MGLTIVHRATGARRGGNPRVALVLAGGGVIGAGYELGGLHALDDFLIDRKTTDLDVYVGHSAGAVLAGFLAAGITPEETLDAFGGEAAGCDALSAVDLCSLNWRQFVAKPLEFVRDVLAYFPSALYDLVAAAPKLARRLEAPVAHACLRPSVANLTECLKPVVDALASPREFPRPLDYLPSGVFDNASLERYVRETSDRRALTNDFRTLHRERAVALYIVAMNLDTAEEVVFGHDEDASVTISEAVQASTALPGFYRPARIRGVDYVDGGMRRTLNMDVAIKHGADLLICYNSFRPLSNATAQPDARRGSRPLAEQGMLAALNQVLRTVVHSRLQLDLRHYANDPRFHGDIIVFEPDETDLSFFEMAPLDLRAGRQAAAYGYVSVKRSIEMNRPRIRQLLQSHGLSIADQSGHDDAEWPRLFHPAANEDLASRDPRLSAA